MIAAGLCAATVSGAAAAESGPTMQLGASALPPQGYVAFCKRQPWDCGAATQQVLARAEQAEAERAALFAAASAVALSSLPAADPAALLAPALASTQAHPALPAQAGATPMVATIARAKVTTQVDFVRTSWTVALEPQAQAESVPAELAEAPPQAAETGPARMTPQLWSKLNRINDQVNHEIRQATDLAVYGKADYWTTPIEDGVAYGDCEDYVLEKERALIAAGVPREALNIAVVTTPWGESHAVLLVDTTEGAMVLDNLSPWVQPWYKTGYRWRQRQVNGDAFHWVLVVDPTRPRTAPSDSLIVASVR